MGEHQLREDSILLEDLPNLAHGRAAACSEWPGRVFKRWLFRHQNITIMIHDDKCGWAEIGAVMEPSKLIILDPLLEIDHFETHTHLHIF